MSLKIFITVLIGLLLAAPLALGDYQLGMVKMALIAALFAIAFNLLNGQAGMLSFGHAAYFAIGGFGTIHAMQAVENGSLALPTPLIPLVGAFAAGVFGLIAALFATKRSGVYFSMVTLAIAELFFGLAPVLQDTFGGESGLSAMRMPWAGFDYGSEKHVYYTVLAWVVIGVALLYLYTRTLFGRLTLGLRESERRLSFLGYDTYATKVVIFAVSALFSGLAGGLLVFVNESVNYFAFAMAGSASVIMHSFVGGATLFLGPALGAVIFSLSGSVLTDVTRNWLLYQGIIFVLVMMFQKEGLATLLMRIGTELRIGNWSRLMVRLWQSLALFLASAGVVFVVELLSRMRSREYLARLVPGQDAPSIALWGYDWQPDGLLTWALPLALLAMAYLISRMTKTRGPQPALMMKGAMK